MKYYNNLEITIIIKKNIIIYKVKFILFDNNANFEITIPVSKSLSLRIKRKAEPSSQFLLIVDLKHVIIRCKLKKVRFAVTVDFERVIKIFRIFLIFA